MNLYFNLTGKAPIKNTLLICNEETTFEEIKAFFFRAIFCECNSLFVISNLECLQISITQEIIKLLNTLHYTNKDKEINSLLIIVYEKEDSGLSRDIKKIIPDKYDINTKFLEEPKNKINSFNDIELYTSKFAGFGKTTEIKYKVKNKNGKYYYLPIGGTLSREFVINNLEKLDLKNGKNVYLHIDLSETDNDVLMNEMLMKLIILRYLDSKDKIYYLGTDIHIIIEIPKGFHDFEEKYKILKLFKKICINKLNHLRLEENAKYIKDSPISIVAETLELFNSGNYSDNIDLEMPLRKSARQCEEIINKNYDQNYKNYYQKMNFIKILSVQFKKLHQSIFLNLKFNDGAERKKVIKNARMTMIQNFIDLSKVFSRSPYDSIISEQKDALKQFEEYVENEIMKNAIDSLENKKTEVFSFQQINPSLVFFNKDGQSLSIISNSDKKEKEYQNLKALWNSQKRLNQKNDEELVNYLGLNHEEFLEEIIKLFSLDNRKPEDLKQFCKKHGNYIFVSDNYIKMVRILLNIEARIPVILMGETGVGKTKLLEVLSELYGNGTCIWKTLQIHAGITDQEIVDFIDKIIFEEDHPKNKNKLIWVFLDEINTCNSLGLITEIMCNHTCLGKKLSDKFVFIGACCPLRVLHKKMIENSLSYYNTKETNKLNYLVYNVNPLPHSLFNFVIDFDCLKEEDEKRYIENTIICIFNELEKKIGYKYRFNDIEINDKIKLANYITNSIIMCHDFIREKYDKSSVSLRDISRFRILFVYFFDYFKKYKSDFAKLKLSWNLSLYLCYYLRLNEKSNRIELSNLLNQFYNNNFCNAPENEIKSLTQKMSIEEEGGIGLNRALREILFSSFVCLETKIPLIIVGKSGTGKSLAFKILYNTLRGEFSESDLFRKKGKLYRYLYQGSETSSSESIAQIFKKANNDVRLNEKNKEIIMLVYFEQMDLAQRANNNPLKILYYLIENNNYYSIPFIGTSNCKLDTNIMNCALNICITDYDLEDLEETAISISQGIDYELSFKYKEFLTTLARTFYDYIQLIQETLQRNTNFHGYIDFYNLIKTSMKELLDRKNELSKNEKKILSETAILSLDRNFGGLEYSSKKMKEIFKKLYWYNFDENVDIYNRFSLLDIIKKNISDNNTRYLMLIIEEDNDWEIIKDILDSFGKKYIELIGSKFKNDLKSGIYYEKILKKITDIINTNSVLILKDLDKIYASLYELFNQNSTLMGDKKFVRIAFEYATISFEVNKDFHCIVIVNKNDIDNSKLSPNFLNRFEKHIVNLKMLLSEKNNEISKKIIDYLEQMSSFNDKKNINMNSEIILINFIKSSIEGLLFKITNTIIKNDEKLKIDDKDYEKIIIKEIFNKIIPKNCQNLILLLEYFKNEIDIKYKEINEILIDICKKFKYDNLKQFFKNLPSKKNIIYSFSKIEENIFEDEINITNKFGVFNIQSNIIENIQSFEEEKELISLLELSMNNKDKKALIIKFSQYDINKINYAHYIIKNFQKNNHDLKERIIVFIIYIERKALNENIEKREINLLQFIDDEYDQIFIEELKRK